MDRLAEGGLGPLLEALTDALAPALCALCRGPPGALPWFCDACAGDLRLLGGRHCLRCGAPRPMDAPLCAHCPPWPRLLVAARSAAPHAGTARRLVHALKYERAVHAAPALGMLAAAAAVDLRLGPDVLVVPVPLHPARRRRRGFNQAHEIARGVASRLGLSLRPALLRRIRHEADSAHRSARGRMRAAKGAFRASGEVRGREILLVDDVLTTGATIGACVRALGRRGASAVWAVTATRALPAWTGGLSEGIKENPLAGR